MIDVLLPVPGPPGHALIETVTASARSVPGVRSVQIRHELMTDEQREDLMNRVRGEKRAVGGPGSSTYVIAVSSGKGGVGKSSVTTNVAVSLAGMGHTVWGDRRRRMGILDSEDAGRRGALRP